MSRTVDERVVSMQFDNQRFEKNIRTTTDSVNKLDQSLRLNNATKGFADLDAAAKRVDVSHLGGALETVKTKFSSLQVMAITALANITNSAVNAGKRIASALTIDPIKSGFQEYETQINAVQTILANTESKGKTLTDVNKALDELNAYADKTIYNFTEMTRNIGTFTAAGVDLDTSVAAIKGIANLAAVSGSTSQQASTAMYQLSQALASGTVKLMDWNSVVNAGMGGQVFQDALKETARVHGIAIDDMIEEQGSFRETLSEGWLSSEILTETLSKFTGDLTEAQLKSMGYTDKQIEGIMKMGQTANDAATKVKTFTQLFDTLKEAAQSGWTQTWEIIVGDFEEAKALLTKVSDAIGAIIGKSAESRNKLLSDWKDLGGRNDLLEGFANIYKAISAIIKPIKEAFREVFPPATAKQLKGITEGFKKLTEHLIIGDKTAANIKKTFKGVFSVISLAVHIIKSVVSASISLFGSISRINKALFGVTGAIGTAMTKTSDAIKRTNIFSKVLGAVVKVINTVVEAIANFAESVKANFKFDAFDLFVSVLKKTADIAKTVFGFVIKTVTAVGKAFLSVFRNGDIERAMDIFNTGLLSVILLGIRKFIGNFQNFGESFSGLGENISNLMESVTGCFQAFQAQIKSKALRNIAISIAILAGSLVVLSMIDPQKLLPALLGMAAIFFMLTKSMNSFSSAFKMKGTFKMITVMMSMSIAVLILAGALKKISGIGLKNMLVSLLGIFGLITILIVSFKMLGENEKATLKAAAQMVIFATAIRILASSCEVLAGLSTKGLIQGLVGVGVLLAAIGLFMTYTKFSDNTLWASAGLIVVAGALKILASVVSDFSNMSTKGVIKGVAAIAVLLAALAGFAKLAGGSTKMFSVGVSVILICGALEILCDVIKKLGSLSIVELCTGLLGLAGALLFLSAAMLIMPNGMKMVALGIGLIGVATALTIITSCVKSMSSLSWSELARGLVGMGVGILAIAAALRVMPQGPLMLAAGAGLIMVGVALNIISSALSKFATMSWNEVAKGLVTLGGAILILAIGTYAMSGAIYGAAALMVASVALTVLAVALKAFEKIGVKGLLISLGALAGMFTILGIAGYALAAVTPIILALCVSLALCGVAAVLCGVGLMALAAGFSSLAVSGVAGATAMISIIEMFIKAIFDGVDIILDGLARLIRGLGQVISDCAGALTKIVVSVVDLIVAVLVKCIPSLTDAVFTVIVSILGSIAKSTPKLVENIAKIIIAVLDGLTLYIPDILKSFMNLLESIFEGFSQALQTFTPELLSGTFESATMLTGIMFMFTNMSALAPGALAGAILAGLFIAELAAVLTGLGKLAEIPNLLWFIDEGAKLMQSVGNAIGSFAGGIVGGLAKGVASALPAIGDDLSDFMLNVDPFINGIKKVDQAALTGVMSMVKIIAALTAARFIDAIASFISGGTSMADFGKQLTSFGYSIAEFSDTVAGNVDSEAVAAAANAGRVMAAMEDTLPKTGGVVGFFEGESDMEAFGKKLVPFGKAICDFSDIVHSGNIDSEAIAAAANAGMIMSEMEQTIPKTGGVVSWFVGQKDMGDFGKRLVEFGKCMASFSETVTDNVDMGAIEAAANAGSTMIELEKTLPKTGGVISWFKGEKDMASFGIRLVQFGRAIVKFSDIVSGNIDKEGVDAANAAGMTMIKMENTLPKTGGVVNWFMGQQDIGSFGNRLVEFGRGMVLFSEAISNADIDEDMVTNAANAGKIMAEMEQTLPKTGGVVSWFVGQKDIGSFGDRLSKFGKGIAAFYDEISGVEIKEDTVDTAANAGEIMVELANTLPKTGGVVSWFTGQKDLGDFGTKLAEFGKGMAEFSNAISGKIDEETVLAAANAGKALVEMQETLPKVGGLADIFTGQKNLSEFGKHLAPFGKAMAEFSDEIKGKIDTESVESAANAGKMIVDMASKLPETGGVFQFFSGEKDVGTFGDRLAKFGKGMAEFSKEVTGKIDAESVTAAANAGKTLAEMASYVPPNDLWTALVDWLSGTDSMTKFSENIVPFGKAMVAFSNEVKGKIDAKSVTAAANAGKTLAQMSNTVPDKGMWDAFVDWLCGDKMSDFTSGIKKFGKAIVEFSKEVSGKDGINVEKVTAAAEAGKKLAEIMVDAKEYEAGDIESFSTGLTELAKGLVSFSTEATKIDTAGIDKGVAAGGKVGDMVSTLPAIQSTDFMGLIQANLLSVFATGLGSFGEALKKFSESSAGINIDNVNKGATAGKAVGEMAKAIPNIGGLSTLFGNTSMAILASQLGSFAKGLTSFSELSANINTENVSKGASAGKIVAEMVNAFPATGGIKAWLNGSVNVAKFGTQLISFAKSIKSFSAEMASLNLVALNRQVANLKTFLDSLSTVAKTGADSFVTAFNESHISIRNAVGGMLGAALEAIKVKETVFKNVGRNFMNEFIDAITEKAEIIKTKFTKIVDASVEAITNDFNYQRYYDAGAYFVTGFASGISQNTYKAAAKSRAMAAAAVNAAKQELDEHSPSKVGYQIGNFFGMPFVDAISKWSKKAYAAGSDLARGAKNGVSKVVEKASDVLNSGSDLAKKAQDKLSGAVEVLSSYLKGGLDTAADYAKKGINKVSSEIANLLDGELNMEPVIRPVLDLTNVRSGVDAINGMFSMKPAVATMSNLGSISSMMSGNRNSGNDDIMSALKELGNKLNNIGGDSYSIGEVSYHEDSDVADAIKTIVKAARVGRRK